MGITRISLAVVILGALSTSEARAQTTIDVTKISCEQFVSMKVADPDRLAIWLSGFYNGKRNNTTVEVQTLKENAYKIKQFCFHNNSGLMEAVEKVLSDKK